MKKIILVLSALLASLPMMAQDDAGDEFDNAVEACITLRNAAATNDTAAIKQSAEQLRACQAGDFATLHQSEDETTSMNGHLVFDEAFADSLSKGIDVYERADSVNRKISERGSGTHTQPRLQTKTIVIKANQTATCSFVAKGTKKIAVVAEAGGRVSMTIQGFYKNKPYTQYVDTKDVKKGMAHRKGTLALRDDCLSSVSMKIKNCVKKDISIVIIMG